MGIKKARRYCPEEERMVLAERQTPNHVLHVILSVVTVGFWIPVWLLVSLLSPGAYRCPDCGARTLPTAPKKR